jgi:invasion protein IalB
MRLLFATLPILLALTACPGPSFAQESETASLKTGAFGDWLVHQNAGDGPKICFAASQPKTKEPAGANRSKIVLYVSAWPKDGVKAEFSAKLGYRMNPASPVSATVDDTAFTLFADEDRAYVADAAAEAKLIEAMKKGTKLVVQATSTRGTQTTDTYSLSGFEQALDAIASACP